MGAIFWKIGSSGLKETNTPESGMCDIQIKVRAVALNPVDYKIRVRAYSRIVSGKKVQNAPTSNFERPNSLL